MGGNPMQMAGTALGFAGGERAAGSAAKGAEAAEREARANRERIITEGRRGEAAANRFAAATPQELNAYNSALTTALTQNAQDLRLMESIDPALMEASSQILKLLRGESTSTGGAYESSRAAQRAKLVDSLRSQYGAGAEMSAIGQRALRDFDAQSTTGSIGLQQSSIGGLSQLLNSRPSAMNSMSMLTQAGQNFGNVSARQATTQLGSNGSMLSALAGANAATLATAGSGHVYGQLAGRNWQQLGNTMLDQGNQTEKNAATLAGAAGGAAASDIRLKENIRPFAESEYEGVPMYSFTYRDPDKHGHGTQIGVMAQDLLKLNPDHPAVMMDDDGYYAVDYSKVELRK